MTNIRTFRFWLLCCLFPNVNPFELVVDGSCSGRSEIHFLCILEAVQVRGQTAFLFVVAELLSEGIAEIKQRLVSNRLCGTEVAVKE